MNRQLAPAVVAIAAAGWLVAILAAPVVLARTPLAGGVYAVGALVCHQRQERSFHLAGARLPVCARCTGLYAGAAMGLIVWTLARRRRRAWPRVQALGWLGLAAAPTALTAATAMAGIADPANPWRAVLALPLGWTAGLIVGAVASDHLK